MAEAQRMEVVLCWHMHQPEYRDLRSGQYQFPWTYLHAVKDYVDMAAHLEAHPGARAVVNFAPVLLEQIADYAAQLEDCLGRGSAIRDPLLAARAEPPMRAYVEESGLSPNQVFGIVRVAVTGQKVSPPLFESMEIIGKEKVLERLERAAQMLENNP